jgi:hypothetical protein
MTNRKTILALSFALTLGLIVILMARCEGYSCAKGSIYDSISKLPIDSVLCTALTGSKSTYSDSTGAYEVCNDFGGCSFGCKDITVRYTKTGYKSKDISKKNFDNVYLEKE